MRYDGPLGRRSLEKMALWRHGLCCVVFATGRTDWPCSGVISGLKHWLASPDQAERFSTWVPCLSKATDRYASHETNPKAKQRGLTSPSTPPDLALAFKKKTGGAAPGRIPSPPSLGEVGYQGTGRGRYSSRRRPTEAVGLRRPTTCNGAGINASWNTAPVGRAAEACAREILASGASRVQRGSPTATSPASSCRYAATRRHRIRGRIVSWRHSASASLAMGRG